MWTGMLESLESIPVRTVVCFVSFRENKHRIWVREIFTLRVTILLHSVYDFSLKKKSGESFAFQARQLFCLE